MTIWQQRTKARIALKLGGIRAKEAAGLLDQVLRQDLEVEACTLRCLWLAGRWREQNRSPDAGWRSDIEVGGGLARIVTVGSDPVLILSSREQLDATPKASMVLVVDSDYEVEDITHELDL